MNKKYNSLFETVIFAGGGSRCFWQLGFWNAVQPQLNIIPSVVAGVSAGAAFACFALASDSQKVVDHFKKAASTNEKNYYIKNVFNKEPVFPHYNMFREAILNAIDDTSLQKLHNGPEVRILLTRPPAWMGPRLAAAVGVAVYNIEKHVFYPLHPTMPTKIGFSGEVIPIQNCATREELAELILQSSCAPPLLPVMRRDNRVVLDGGMIDNVPLRIVEDCKGSKLVLLTRKYRDDMIPKNSRIKYIQPSEEIPIPKWEYTDPDGVQLVYDMGRRDGEAFVKEHMYAC